MAGLGIQELIVLGLIGIGMLVAIAFVVLVLTRGSGKSNLMGRDDRRDDG